MARKKTKKKKLTGKAAQKVVQNTKGKLKTAGKTNNLLPGKKGASKKPKPPFQKTAKGSKGPKPPFQKAAKGKKSSFPLPKKKKTNAKPKKKVKAKKKKR